MSNSKTITGIAKFASCLAFTLSPQLLLADNYSQINLVSDMAGKAAVTDPNLKNPWGVAFAPSSPFWISNQGSSTSTLYDGAGNIIPLVVAIPAGAPPSGPTGQVFNGTSSFALANGSAPHFIFDTLNGTIDGWSGGSAAVQAVSTPGALYTGLALASAGSANYLYAADATGKIRVFDSAYHSVTLSGHFSDPGAMTGYVPFNIQLLGSTLYVTYAQLSAAGTGLPGGYIDEFDTSGNFVKRLTSGGALYAPWGLTVAPSTYGMLGGDLLVGNFGNGEILAYNNTSGAFVGTLNGADGKPIVNDFLWSLNFRTAGTNVNTNALYFTAGINNQQDGLFGAIADVPEPAATLEAGLGLAAIGLFSLYRRRLARSTV